jgi:hypothetical protein
MMLIGHTRRTTWGYGVLKLNLARRPTRSCYSIFSGRVIQNLGNKNCYPLSGGETWTDPQGGDPSGCRLTWRGSRTKSVGGSSRVELGTRRE